MALQTGLVVIFCSRFDSIWGIVRTMKKSLLETNPYLKNPAERDKALARSVVTSSAIEGIRVTRNAKTGQFVAQSKDLKHSAKSVKISR